MVGRGKLLGHSSPDCVMFFYFVFYGWYGVVVYGAVYVEEKEYVSLCFGCAGVHLVSAALVCG